METIWVIMCRSETINVSIPTGASEHLSSGLLYVLISIQRDGIYSFN